MKKKTNVKPIFVGSIHEYNPRKKKFNLLKCITWIVIALITIGGILLWFYAYNKFESHG